MFGWFKRDWELLDKTILPSAFEQLRESNQSLTKADTICMSFFRKKVVYIFKCKLTGKIKKVIESNP